MQIPKRKQILRIQVLNSRRDNEYLVLVTGIGPKTRSRKRTFRCICLAKRIMDQNWTHKNLDEEWSLKLYGMQVELVERNDLPLYLDWDHGKTFEKILKGEL